MERHTPSNGIETRACLDGRGELGDLDTHVARQDAEAAVAVAGRHDLSVRQASTSGMGGVDVTTIRHLVTSPHSLPPPNPAPPQPD